MSTIRAVETSYRKSHKNRHRSLALPLLIVSSLALGGVAPVANAATVDANVAVAAGEEFTYSTDGTQGRYRVFSEGVDFSQPVSVVLRLHGDGAYEYDNPSYALDDYAEVANSHNAVLIAPRTPDPASTTWWTNSQLTGNWLAGFVDDVVVGEYGFDYSDVYWMGYSGGAELLTRHFILTHPEQVSGGALLLGGGGRPWGFSNSDIASAAGTVGPLTWKTGTADNGTRPNQSWDAYSAVQQGVEFYEGRGFNTRAEFPAGVDHFGLEQAATLDVALTGWTGAPARGPVPVEPAAVEFTDPETSEPVETPAEGEQRGGDPGHHDRNRDSDNRDNYGGSSSSNW